MPSAYTFGNGATTIGYTANGEASDWMLQERGIYAMSPEIGIEDSRSNTFFIKDPSVLLDVCQQNFVWIRGIMERFSDRLYLFFEQGSKMPFKLRDKSDFDMSILSELTIRNSGLADAANA